jgi:hypothetical protein
VLLLFGCGFGGANDGKHVRAAGKENVTAVDSDPLAVDLMAREYPPAWSFQVADAFAYARHAAKSGVRWDLVSVDLPSNMPLEMVDALPLWMSIAGRYVVSTVMRHNFPGSVDPAVLMPVWPRGWKCKQLVERSAYRGGLWWLVSEREV